MTATVSSCDSVFRDDYADGHGELLWWFGIYSDCFSYFTLTVEIVCCSEGSSFVCKNLIKILMWYSVLQKSYSIFK